MIDDFKIENKEEFSKEDLNVFKQIVMDANEVRESTFDGKGLVENDRSLS